MKLILDGKKIKDVETFHDKIEKTSLMHGRNLDALYDVLTSARAHIIIKNTAALRDNLGGCADEILNVIREADEFNDFLTVEYDND